MTEGGDVTTLGLLRKVGLEKKIFMRCFPRLKDNPVGKPLTWFKAVGKGFIERVPGSAHICQDGSYQIQIENTAGTDRGTVESAMNEPNRTCRILVTYVGCICDALQQNREKVAQAYFEIWTIIEVDIGCKMIHLSILRFLFLFLFLFRVVLCCVVLFCFALLCFNLFCFVLFLFFYLDWYVFCPLHVVSDWFSNIFFSPKIQHFLQPIISKTKRKV